MLPLPHGEKLIQIPDLDIKKFGKSDLEHTLEVSYETAVTIMGIKTGILSPLEGFPGYSDYESVLREQRLENGLPWSIPSLLTLDDMKKSGLREGESIVLSYHDIPLAELSVSEIYDIDKDLFCKSVFGTTSDEHPGVRKARNFGNKAIGGRIVGAGYVDFPFKSITAFPSETRKYFMEKGWKTVSAFQTRNVPHRGHEDIQRMALRNTDGLFINPVIGRKKAGDYTDEAILMSYRALIEHYYPPDRVLMTPLHYEMMYAGPREAVMHAIMRKNYGCSHFIVGRDHAGVGDFYGPYDAQKNLASFDDLGVEIIYFQETFYCQKCEQLVTEKECAHSKEQQEHFSGTKLRNLIVSKGTPSKELMRREVYEALATLRDPFVR